MVGPVRRAAVAGTWYPSDPRRLIAEVDRHLEQADVDQASPPGDRLVALISPHAGLVYSGPVAAYGYRLLRTHGAGSVVLVGPSHHEVFQRPSVYASGRFETPLGPLEVDVEAARALLAAGRALSDDAEPHYAEHSLEMQLPFLKRLLPDAAIVPVLMGEQSRSAVEALASALVEAFAARPVLFVASSDLSHYHDAAEAARLDARVVEAIARFDPELLLERLAEFPHHACGGGPIAAVMKAARGLGARRATVLRYADSGDIPGGDKSRVVGYLSAAFWAG